MSAAVRVAGPRRQVQLESTTSSDLVGTMRSAEFASVRVG